MTRRLPALGAVLAGLMIFACTKTAAPPPAGLDFVKATEEQRAFYVLGLMLGKNLTRWQLQDDELPWVMEGLRDAARQKEARVDPSDFGPRLARIEKVRMSLLAAPEKEKHKPFLEKEAAKPGAVVSPSGLIYFSVSEGKGASPGPTDSVAVNYKGTLPDGKQFDSSYDRGQPIQFQLNRVISCWTEGLQKMKPGGKARLVCPSDIAYGDAGSPPVIPPGTPLVFEVELLGVAKAASPVPAAPQAPPAGR